MELANQLILLSSALILVSIFAGMISQRFGAPLLLVFLVLGMLVGEDGPGGVEFNDFGATYLVGSVALAIILFDGGLRTRWDDLRSVLGASAVLATFGVVVTAVVTGVAAKYLMGVGWLEGMLIGSIVASTDAAAVFLLLHLRGMRLRDRLRAVLEAEAGLNDPMAVLLTVTCVTLFGFTEVGLTWQTAQTVVGMFVVQMAGGILFGLAGGYILLFLINRLEIAAGLYPILVVSGALALFAGAQEIGASGFLTAYLAGLVVGNRRHKATLIINRFHDGLAWLSQILMFLILGLLVTPTRLVGTLVPALGIAAVLMFVARPAAIALLLPVFRFEAREIAFVSWVGLRGAVPIFLGTIPVLAGIEDAETYFGVVYIVVMASLVVQGWTIGWAGRRFGVVLPPRPAVPPRFEIDLPSDVGRDMTAYSVQPASLALRRPLARLPLSEDVTVVSVIRDGSLRAPESLDRLAPGDDVLLMAPAGRLPLLDRVFGAPQESALYAEVGLVGEFPFDGETPLGAIAEVYGFAVPANQRTVAVAEFLRRHLFGPARTGRRLRLGPVELVVQKIEHGLVTRVSIELEPREWSIHRLDPAHVWLRSLLWVPAATRARSLAVAAAARLRRRREAPEDSVESGAKGRP